MSVRLFFGHATKNSFLLALTRSARHPSAKTIAQICRIVGLRVDGFVLLQMRPRALPLWRFWNADGSRARFCGNAARLSLAFLARRGISGFQCEMGEISHDTFESFDRQSWDLGLEIEMRVSWHLDPSKIEIQASRDGQLLTVGNPHLIVDSPPDLLRAKILRTKYEANVTFVQARPRNLWAVTFERGVEAFTQSCGTGALAASFVYGKSKIEMPGGDLRVHWGRDSVSLQGKVQWIAEVKIPKNLRGYL